MHAAVRECVNKALTFRPDMVILNRIISDSEDMVKTLRFEKGLKIYILCILKNEINNMHMHT